MKRVLFAAAPAAFPVTLNAQPYGSGPGPKGPRFNAQEEVLIREAP